MIGISQPTNFALRYARFQRNNLWDVLLPDIGFQLGGLVGFALSQFIQEVSFGDYDISKATTMRYGPYQASFASNFEVGQVTMKFIKTMPDIVSPYFNAWKNLIIGPDGLYNPKSKYQKTIYIRFIDSTGLAIGQYKLKGCFPVKFPAYNLSYGSNEVVKVEVQFKVDKIEYTAF